jgi:HAD superfamily hydrolase (TIGR01509 family)
MEPIHTPRLILRPFSFSDWEAVHEYASDPETTRHMLWGPNTSLETQAFLRLQLDPHNRNPDVFAYALVLRETGKLIGSCSLRVEQPAVEEHRDSLGSIGYILNRAFWGRGFATECAYALLVFGFERLGLMRITATCRPENEASRHVLEKTGMQLEAHLRDHVIVRGQLRDTVRFAIEADHWRRHHFKAAIFDMDGVILDSEPIYFATNQELFSDLGFEVKPLDYAQFVGLDAAQMWVRLKDRHGLPHEVEVLIQMEADGMIAGLQSAPLLPMPGLLELIDRLRSSGFKLALASSSKHRVIRTILDSLDLSETFSAVVSGEDVAHGKPAPDIFLRTASLLGVPPSGCLVIEDSANGVRAAKAAGMQCFGLRNPSSGAQDLSLADRVVDSLDQILIPST